GGPAPPRQARRRGRGALDRHRAGRLAGPGGRQSGWGGGQQTFFNWDVFRETFPDVARGFWLDVKLFLAVEAVVLVLGLLVAICRISRMPALFPLRLLATVYTHV